MTWLTANWFWLLVFIGFIAMHLFGHGGHGGHGGGHRQPRRDDSDTDEARGRAVGTSASGHQH